jgi:hypothetical protein
MSCVNGASRPRRFLTKAPGVADAPVNFAVASFLSVLTPGGSTGKQSRKSRRQQTSRCVLQDDTVRLPVQGVEVGVPTSSFKIGKPVSVHRTRPYLWSRYD